MPFPSLSRDPAILVAVQQERRGEISRRHDSPERTYRGLAPYQSETYLSLHNMKRESRCVLQGKKKGEREHWIQAEGEMGFLTIRPKGDVHQWTRHFAFWRHIKPALLLLLLLVRVTGRLTALWREKEILFLLLCLRVLLWLAPHQCQLNLHSYFWYSYSFWQIIEKSMRVECK